MKITKLLPLFLAGILFVSCTNQVTITQDIKLPVFFSDNMVLQQKSDVPFFGEATPESELTITTSWNHKEYSAKADKQGKFRVELKTPAYGGPYELVLEQQGKKTTFKNVLIGEVWLCSGQSNMEMPLAGWGEVKDFKEEIAKANYPEIRLLQATHINSEEPLDSIVLDTPGWQLCSPQTIPEFSSTAYFFARKVYETTKIPIGLIHSSWGGTIVEAWTSAESLKTIHDFDAEIAAMYAGKEEKQKIEEENTKKMETWHKQVNAVDAGYSDGKPMWLDKESSKKWETTKLPALWETTILPDFDGLVWLQKSVDLPKEAIGKTAELHYVADDDDKVWINGTFIGATEGYNIPRNYTIPKGVLKEGVNVIAVRIYDSGGGGGIYGDPGELYLKVDGVVYPLSGVWKYKVSVTLDKTSVKPVTPGGPNRPTVLYNAMIHPLLDYKIRGAIWYQGESNADRAMQYRRLFPLLIKDWRKQFNNPDMPFYFVQLASYKQRKEEPAPSEWAELREAQLYTLETVPNTGMAVAIDIGEAEDIHPKNKQEVGARLAKIALANVYGQKITFSGPVYKSVAKNANTMVISFEFSEGLHSQNNQPLKGFEIAGADQKFYWAEAEVKDGKVVVSSPKVADPVAVRYGWADNPDVNLYNGADLPASPFRTDEWPGITRDK